MMRRRYDYRHHSFRHYSFRRRGLSLLEVLLSVAILGMSMVAIGHLFNLGFRAASDVRVRSEANMIADATMAEIAAGVIDFKSAGGTVESKPDWQYVVSTQPSVQPGLLSVTVTVSQRQSTSNVSVSLVRFVADPDYEPEQDEG
jgi:prepilin-type N-terminal cleavage/methylation domain-containing protein